MQATRQTPRIGEKVARWGWKGKGSARKRANGERIESRTTTESIMDGNGRTVEWKGKVFGNLDLEFGGKPNGLRMNCFFFFFFFFC